MIQDPWQLYLGGTAVVPSGGALQSFNKQVPGSFVAGTTDEPMILTVRNKVNLGYVSQFNVSLRRDKNLPPISGIPQKDASLFASLLVKNDPNFAVSDTKSLLIALLDAVVAGTTLDRLMRGEL